MKGTNYLPVGASVMAVLITLLFASCQNRTIPSSSSNEKQVWITTADKRFLFQKQDSFARSVKSATSQTVIEIDEKRKFQEMDGFGFTLTGGSAIHLNGMSPAARNAIIRELFGIQGNNIGISYLRLSIGASDLSDHLFSYNDLPAGETDTAMIRFSIDPERKDLLPVLKQILAVNPNIKIMGSPWSPPVWMKTNKDTRGGSLLPQYYDAYAKYFVRYIEEMKKEGIRIDAVTVQNEPLHPGNNPSLLMLPGEQAQFIKRSLGPAFRQAGIDTKIILYDHNADRPDYPITILNDKEAKPYIDGSAFHLYGGTIDALSKVHEAHPDKSLYFTEQWIGAPGNFPEDLKWHTSNLVIGAPRNWCRTVLEWNLTSNSELTPYTDRGGCNRCLGAVTIDKDMVTRNPAYYIIAHASKFVRPGSVRIHSNSEETLPNVAYVTPAGERVLIVLNADTSPKEFSVKDGRQFFQCTLPAGSVATFVW